MMTMMMTQTKTTNSKGAPMKVRCKMECIRANSTGEGDEEQHEAGFMAVADGSAENEEFFKSTPYGEMSLGVVTKQHFEVGKSYYIDIELAE